MKRGEVVLHRTDLGFVPFDENRDSRAIFHTGRLLPDLCDSAFKLEQLQIRLSVVKRVIPRLHDIDKN
jgi:hypothetical protein